MAVADQLESASLPITGQDQHYFGAQVPVPQTLNRLESQLRVLQRELSDFDFSF